MANPKVLVYTPMGDVDAKYSELEDVGCEVTFGNAEWRRAFGAEAITIREESEVADAIARAFAVKTRPVVVHCLTSALQMSAWRRYGEGDVLP